MQQVHFFINKHISSPAQLLSRSNRNADDATRATLPYLSLLITSNTSHCQLATTERDGQMFFLLPQRRGSCNATRLPPPFYVRIVQSVFASGREARVLLHSVGDAIFQNRENMAPPNDGWTEELSIRLIREFKARPMLWDKSHNLFYKPQTKMEIWEEIGSIIGMPAKACKHKMSILMSSLRREKCKLRRLSNGKY